MDLFLFVTDVMAITQKKCEYIVLLFMIFDSRPRGRIILRRFACTMVSAHDHHSSETSFVSKYWYPLYVITALVPWKYLL